MAQAAVTSSSSKDTVFRSFGSEQAKHYALNRRGYHPDLYSAITSYHTGQFDTILDVGRGPGMAVRDLARYFTHAIGIDPSDGMISTARELGGVTSSAEPIQFEVSSAEDLGASIPVPEGSLDLITAAVAAHWFDMPAFWARAARVLKPGGTVAIWTGASISVDASTPNHERVQAAIQWQEDLLADYMTEGNRLNRDLYRSLPLPWTVTPPISQFDQDSFIRTEWGTHPDSKPGDQFYAIQPPANLDTMEIVLGTTSHVTRWREAHPEVVGTERDVVRTLRRKIEEAFAEVGVEKGREIIKGGVTGVLLMVRKKAE